MPTFQYRALTQVGEVVTGSLDATSLAEVNRRVEYLGLIPIEAASARNEAKFGSGALASLRLSGPRAEDVTIFTGDLALLLHTGARINDALELLATDAEMSRMRPTAASLASAILSGDSFGEAISRHPKIFPPIYVALIRIGETSGALVAVLEALAAERQRAEALRRRISDALRYPAFLLLAAGAVLIFFLNFVLPQFGNIFREFNAKLDPVLATFLQLSDFMRSNGQTLAGALRSSACWPAGSFCAGPPRAGRSFARLRACRSCAPSWISTARVSSAATSASCLSSGVLLDFGAAHSGRHHGVDRNGRAMVAHRRQGASRRKAFGRASGNARSPADGDQDASPREESGQLAMLAGRIADFYEAKLQRSLDRAIGVVGPLAIIIISLIVGGLIVSVMTALLSVYQVVD